MEPKKKPTPKETVYPVEGEDTLLPFLLAHVKGKSRNTVKNLLAKRQVRVNGKTVTRFDHPLAPGQTVTLLPPAAEQPVKPPFKILYEDEGILVIDKPAGLLTMASDKEKDLTAYHILTDYRKGIDPAGRVFIVHRLDRDTSGVVLFAKDEGTKRAFQEDWDKRVKRRAYLAVVEGAPAEREGVVRSWLHETATHLVYSGAPGRDAKKAVTRYRVLESRGGFSLVEVELETGRKNQIRAHMQDLGCPVAEDRQYGGSRGAMGRLGLHASELILIDPRTGEERSFMAPMPREFRKLFPDQR